MVRSAIHVAVNVDLPSQLLERAREITQAELWTPEQLAREPALYRKAEVAVVRGAGDHQWLRETPSLRWIQTVGAGVDNLLNDELHARSELVITNASGIHAQPIAEHVLGLLLAFTRNLHLSIRQQQSARWDAASASTQLSSLQGKTLGVLGLGAIGKRVAEVAHVFGARVIGLKRKPEPTAHVAQVFGPEQLHAFLAQSELLVNILPLTPTTRGLLGARELAALPKGALYVNVGRGATTDTAALLDALRSGHLAGAGLDVTDPEPLPADHILWSLPNVIITPHYAGAQPDYFRHAGELFVDNLRRYVAGEALRNVVDKSAGY